MTLLVAACSRTSEPPPAPLAAAAYAGSAACGTCHERQYDEWRGSHHELAMQPANDATVLGDFSGTSFDYYGERAEFLTVDGRYVVRTLAADGRLTDYPVEWVFGLEPLQQYLVAFPRGRLQALPFAWDTRAADAGGQRWFHLYPDEHIEPGDELHWTGPQQNWNYMCAECHSTNLELGYDLATDSFATTYSELSVGCEGCHGPGSSHIRQAESGQFDNSRRGLEVDLDDQGRATWVMNVATGIAERSELAMRVSQQPETCGRCHSRRGIASSSYEHGQPLTDTHLPSLLAEGLYFTDGQILDEVYVYGSFIQSRMYRAGVTCGNCHNPHTAKLLTGENPNDVCAQCHLPTTFAAASHTGHEDGDVGCVDCHMTSRTYMVNDDRRDHSFRVPRPDLSEATGAPDACTSCHTDKTPDWATAAIVGWHGEAFLERFEFGSAIAAARSGNANAALVAVINRTDTPGIARATALGELSPPLGREDVSVIESALVDADPLVRVAALRVFRGFPPDFRQRYAERLLDDDVRSVRIEAALAFADMQSSLTPAARAAFRRASSDLHGARLAIANRTEAHTGLGDFAAASGDFEQAQAHYERALTIDPRFTPARANLADILRVLGNDARGAEIIAAGLELNPDDAALHHAHGLVLVRIGDADAGIRALQKAAELEPGDSRYAYVVGIGLNSLGQADEALAVLTHAWERFRGDYDIGMALASIHRDAGNTEAALETVDALLEEFPEDRSIWALRASLTGP